MANEVSNAGVLGRLAADIVVGGMLEESFNVLGGAGVIAAAMQTKTGREAFPDEAVIAMRDRLEEIVANGSAAEQRANELGEKLGL